MEPNQPRTLTTRVFATDKTTQCPEFFADCLEGSSLPLRSAHLPEKKPEPLLDKLSTLRHAINNLREERRQAYKWLELPDLDERDRNKWLHYRTSGNSEVIVYRLCSYFLYKNRNRFCFSVHEPMCMCVIVHIEDTQSHTMSTRGCTQSHPPLSAIKHR